MKELCVAVIEAVVVGISVISTVLLIFLPLIVRADTNGMIHPNFSNLMIVIAVVLLLAFYMLVMMVTHFPENGECTFKREVLLLSPIAYVFYWPNHFVLKYWHKKGGDN